MKPLMKNGNKICTSLKLNHGNELVVKYFNKKPLLKLVQLYLELKIHLHLNPENNLDAKLLKNKIEQYKI